MGYWGDQSSLDDLCLRVRWVYEWKREPNWKIRQISYPFTLIWLILSGNKTLQFPEAEYTLKKGDLVVIPPQVLFKTITDINETETEQFHYLALACEARIGSFDLVTIYDFPLVTPITSLDSIQSFIALWYRLLQQMDHFLTSLNSDTTSLPNLETFLNRSVILNTVQTLDYFQLHSLGTQWLTDVIRIVHPCLPPTPHLIDSRIQKACTFIRNRLNEDISLSILAHHCFLSENHLILLFNRALHITPMKYVRQERIRYARELLLMTSCSMNEIAQMCGFADSSPFSRSFRLEVGISPQQYRKQSNDNLL